MNPSRVSPSARCLVIAVVVLAAAFGVLLSSARLAAATTYIPGGTIGSGSTVILGPTGTPVPDTTYILVGNLTVASNANLTIQPGTTLLFNNGTHIAVDGFLWAIGSAVAPITFRGNATSPGVLWGGVQFDSGGQGAVVWSNISHADAGVFLRGSSALVANDTVDTANSGIRVLGSASVRILGNTVNHAITGIELTGASGLVQGNRINSTALGINAQNLGSLTIADNRITNVTSSPLALLPSIAINVNGLTSATVTGNTIDQVVGLPGSTPAILGAYGSTGAPALGILVNATGYATIIGNRVTNLTGGAGGNGANGLASAGAGGSGGVADGITVVASQTLTLQGNTVSTVAGGLAGNGGQSASGIGGNGGRGGGAAGIDVYEVLASPVWSGNSVSSVTGGSGGDGAAGLTSYGDGGAAGDAYGLLLGSDVDAQPASNTFSNIRGGSGGISNPLAAGGALGGAGGQAYGVFVLGADGTTTLHANAISTVVGGSGGAGYQAGGPGGNATGVILFGDGAAFNATMTSYNQVGLVLGGFGGTGHNLGGAGGGSIGLIYAHVAAFSSNDTLTEIIGGDGGNATVGNPAGQGGTAAATGGFLVRASDWNGTVVQTVQRGGFGIGTAPAPSFGAALYVLGNATVASAATFTNATISGASDYDLYVDNYSSVTAVNTPLGWSRIQVQSAANLTVRSFLAVRVRYPDNVTYLPGATVLVTDDGVPVWNRASTSGQVNWILVTGRTYRGSSTPVENVTNASVALAGDSFAASPRTLNMSASQTAYFVANDTVPPVSSASPLPAYERVLRFPVNYTVTDGYGVGVANVSLWYRAPGTDWRWYAAQTGAGTGTFDFSASGDGAYGFATVATDLVGNTEALPLANETSTIVDTVAPSSRVLALPAYETSLSFLVSWAPGPGVTDIATYTIQYDAGAGWVTWLSGVTSASQTFTAAGQGPVAFRSVATDFAGNVEAKSGNDTWTLVDTGRPQVLATTPVGNQSTLPTSFTITFSEAMNESSVETAFSVSPAVTGSFSWNAAGTVVTFTPSAPLADGASYAVTVGTGARDLAGNALAQPATFTFATPAAPSSGLDLGGLWWVFLLLAVAAAGLVVFYVLRRRGAGSLEPLAEAPKAPPEAAVPAKPVAAIDDVFLLYRRDGVLIKHETRRLRPDIDTDILSGMLTAVQQFVKDSFRGDEDEELNEMTVGQMHILIGRGKYLILAATITGGDVESMSAQIGKAIEDMETHQWDRLDEWDGDMDLGKVLAPYVKKLIRGEYA